MDETPHRLLRRYSDAGTDVSGEPTFRGLLDRVFRTAFEAFYHQELPFQYVVSETDPERVLSSSGLPQVMLVLHDFPFPSVDTPELSVEVLEIHTGSAMFDLSVEFVERDGRLVGWILIRQRVVRGRDDRQDGGTFSDLVEGAVEGPDRRVSDLPLLAYVAQVAVEIPRISRESRRHGGWVFTTKCGLG